MSATPTERLESVDATASTLNRLIRTSIGGEKGFRAAAGGVSDANLKRLFESYSLQRAEFAAELQEELRRYAANAAASGQAGAALDRSLLDDQPSVTGKDDGTIFSECERGEDATVKTYETALSSPLPSELRSIVERQLVRIKEGHDQLRSLERAHDRHT
ncbi:MAG TPA: PA2169 family four-helix-bundle protein [Gemmatimonadales bacterium]|nr:PA2169 family four-helix-bundle protein [Gemmatimonadales bacterium]